VYCDLEGPLLKCGLRSEFGLGVLVRISEYVSRDLGDSRQWNAKKPVYVVVSKIVDNREQWKKLVTAKAEIWGLDPTDDAATLAKGTERLQEEQRLMVQDSSFAEERRIALGNDWDRIVPIRTIELLVIDYFQYLNGPKEINGMPLDQRFPLPSLAHCLDVCKPNSIHRYFEMSGMTNGMTNPVYIPYLHGFMYSAAEQVHRQLNDLPKPKWLGFPIKNPDDRGQYKSGCAKVFFPQRTPEQIAAAASKKTTVFDSSEQDLTAQEYKKWLAQKNIEYTQRLALIDYIKDRAREEKQCQETTK
jgi:hypothetical protein